MATPALQMNPHTFETWLGFPVILHVILADARIPVRGTLVGESGKALSFHLREGQTVDIPRNLVIGIEKDPWSAIF